MKNINLKDSILGIFLLFVPCLLHAQDKKNIVEYGSFYELKQYSSDKPQGWNISSNFYGVKEGDMWKRPGSSDNRSLRLQPDKQYVVSTNLNGMPNILLVEPGAEYELAIWAKDVSYDPSGANRMNVNFDWYAEKEPGTSLSSVMSEKVGQTMEMTTEWKCYKTNVKIPPFANSAALKLTFLTNGSMLLLDDITMVKTKGPSFDEVLPPMGVKKTAYQHEIEVSWLPSTDEDVTWQAQLDDGKIIDLGKKNSLTFKRLVAGQSYVVSIWGVKGNSLSEKVVEKISTVPFEYAENDIRRIPYLKTISDDGYCWRYLKLYFYELYKLDATITYKQDGKTITPNEEGVLELSWKPTVSEYYDKAELEIMIDEGGGKKWTLTYQLMVSKDLEN